MGKLTWAHYLVKFGTQWELDSRDAPKDWPTGYIGINTKGPNEKPPLDYKTEVFELNPKLQAKAFALSHKVELSESKESVAWRMKYPSAPVWTKLLTDNKGEYCTTLQEDNSNYEALLRASREGLVDVQRLAVENLYRTGNPRVQEIL